MKIVLILAIISLGAAAAHADEITQPIVGNYDTVVALDGANVEKVLKSAPMLSSGAPIIIELTGDQAPGHVHDTSHAMIEIEGMFPDDARCLISYQGICFIRGHRLEIR